jgi:hypothetical protein
MVKPSKRPKFEFKPYQVKWLITIKPRNWPLSFSHCKSTLEMERAMMVDLTKAQARAGAVTPAINRKGAPHPAFTRASQNVAIVAALLGTLTTPFANGVDNMYRQLKDILGVTAVQ